MICDPSSESQKKVVIQCAYTAQMPPEKALIFAQSSFAPVTLDEVIKLYKSFEGDEQKSIDDKSQTNSTSLENSSTEEMESDQGSSPDSDESQEKKDYFTTVADEKKVVLECAYYAQMPPEKALIFAQSSFAPVTLDEVIKLYKSFKDDESKIYKTNSASRRKSSAKKMELDQGSPPDSDESQEKRDYFTTVANEILNEVLKYSTIEDQKILHQTNFGISSYLLSRFKSYEYVTVLISGNATQITLKEQEAPITRSSENEIKLGKRPHDDNKVVKKDNTKTFSVASVSEALTKLHSILHLPETPVKIGRLDISFEKLGPFELKSSESPAFYTGFQKILAGLKFALHVEELNIPIDDPESLLAILNGLRPGSLTSIHLSYVDDDEDEDEEDDEPFDMERIVASEHWKYIKKLHMQMSSYNISLTDIINMEKVFMEFEVISVEDILNHKDKLLQFPMRRDHSIGYEYGSMDGLREALIPFRPTRSERTLWNASLGSFLDINKQRLNVRVHERGTRFWYL